MARGLAFWVENNIVIQEMHLPTFKFVKTIVFLMESSSLSTAWCTLAQTCVILLGLPLCCICYLGIGCVSEWMLKQHIRKLQLLSQVYWLNCFAFICFCRCRRSFLVFWLPRGSGSHQRVVSVGQRAPFCCCGSCHLTLVVTLEIKRLWLACSLIPRTTLQNLTLLSFLLSPSLPVPPWCSWKCPAAD